MIEIIIISLCAIFFAIAQAAHNAPTVIYMEWYVDAKDWQMDRFHRYNSWAKFFFCLAASFIGVSIIIDWYTLLLLFSNGLLSGLWIWLVFDPALSLMRKPSRKWYYLGLNDADGKRWIRWFGAKNAGKWKAVILFALIVVTVTLKLIFLCSD